MLNPHADLKKWTLSSHRGEYLCEHGIGHGNHVHGCDGCCNRSDYPLKGVVTNEGLLETTLSECIQLREIGIDNLYRINTHIETIQEKEPRHECTICGGPVRRNSEGFSLICSACVSDF